MKTQKIVIVALLIVLFVGGVLWRLDEAFFADRSQTLEFQLRTQVTSLVQSFQTEINFWQKVPMKDIKQWPFWQASADLNHIDETFIWNESFFGPQTKKEWLIKKIKSLTMATAAANSDSVSGTFVSYNIFFDQDQKPRAAVVIRAENHTWVVLTQMDAWQSWVELYRGPGSEIFVMTSDGASLAHGQRDYVGQKATDHPVYKIFQQKPELQQLAQTMKLTDQKNYSVVAEKVPSSNLLVVSARPLADAMVGRSALRWQVLSLGIGILFLVCGFLFFGKKSGDETFEVIHDTEKNPNVIESPAAPTQVAMANKELSADEKIVMYKSIASALGHELRAPLSAVISLAQSASTTPNSDSVQGYMESILRETREARGTLDKILGFSGQKVTEKIAMKLESPVRKVLKKMEPLFNSKNVVLKVQIEDHSLLPMDQESLMKALENLLLNAVQSMDRQLEKNLNVAVINDGSQVLLSITDTGQGMAPDILQKARDPFFTTRSFAHHLGLGLPEAEGILKEHQAQVQIQSRVGGGTRIEIRFQKPLESEKLATQLAAPSGEFAEAMTTSSIQIVKPTSETLAPASSPAAIVQPPVAEIAATSNQEVEMIKLSGQVISKSSKAGIELNRVQQELATRKGPPPPVFLREQPAPVVIKTTTPLREAAQDTKKEITAVTHGKSTPLNKSAKVQEPPRDLMAQYPAQDVTQPMARIDDEDVRADSAITRPQAPEEPEDMNELLEHGPETEEEQAIAADQVSKEEVTERMKQLSDSKESPMAARAIPKPDIKIEKTKSVLEDHKVTVRRPGSRSS